MLIILKGQPYNNNFITFDIFSPLSQLLLFFLGGTESEE